MPDKKGRLNGSEQVFAKVYADTGNATLAAKEAGYAHPRMAGSRNLSRPGVQAEIVRQQVSRLTSEALPAAVNCLISIVTNENAPAGARVQASKVILDRTVDTKDAADSKEPHEMTGDELADAIAKLERQAADFTREAAERAKPVEAIEIAPGKPATAGARDLALAASGEPLTLDEIDDIAPHASVFG